MSKVVTGKGVGEEGSEMTVRRKGEISKRLRNISSPFSSNDVIAFQKRKWTWSYVKESSNDSLSGRYWHLSSAISRLYPSFNGMLEIYRSGELTFQFYF